MKQLFYLFIILFSTNTSIAQLNIDSILVTNSNSIIRIGFNKGANDADTTYAFRIKGNSISYDSNLKVVSITDTAFIGSTKKVGGV